MTRKLSARRNVPSKNENGDVFVYVVGKKTKAFS